MRFDFNMVVWGDSYVATLLDAVLPNQATPGNLGAFQGAEGCRYRIFTRPQDAQRIIAAPIFRRLEAMVAVEFVLDDELGADAGHEASYQDMTRCHRRGLAEAADEQAAIVFLPADCLWSEGSFAAMARRRAEGKLVVLNPGIRLVRETAYQPFLAQFLDAATGAAPAPARALAALALEHLHPLTRAAFHDMPDFISWPSNVLWRAPDGFIVRAFHLHPFMIDTQGRDVRYEISLDQDLIGAVCPDAAAIHVAMDSDEILQVSLENLDHRRDLLPEANRLSLQSVIEWARKYSEPVQRQLFVERACLVHAGDVGPDWRAAQLASARFADKVRVLLGL
jgi:hypothetical protein